MANAERPTQPEVQPSVRLARFRGMLSAPFGTTVTTEVTRPASEARGDVVPGVLAGAVQYLFFGARLKRDPDVAVTAQASMELPFGVGTVEASLDLSQADLARAQRIALACAQRTIDEARLREPSLGAAYNRVIAGTETHVDVTVTTLWGRFGAQRGTNARLAHNVVAAVTRDTARRETIRRLTAASDTLTATGTAIGQAITNPQPPSREEVIQLACRFC